MTELDEARKEAIRLLDSLSMEDTNVTRKDIMSWGVEDCLIWVDAWDAETSTEEWFKRWRVEDE